MRALVISCLVVVVACSGRATGPTVGSGTGTGSGTGSGTGDDGDTTPCAEPRPAADYQCIQDCGPPVVREGDPPPAWRWLGPEEVEARERGGCPRCLPPEARIATPDGDVAITSLTVGARVLTVDAGGRRRIATVVRVGTTPVRHRHVMIRATLADGRVVTASPEHPTADGRTLRELAVGATLDASAVISLERIAFTGERTWDILPSGPTGRYIADGVVLGSTLTD